jgi:phage shock protein A
MDDLFKKLNTLIKASLADIVGEDNLPGKPRRHLDPHKLGKDVDREIGTLRGRVNDALAYEDELQGRVAALQAEVARWDQQADVAVQGSDEANARYAVEQMQRAQQRLTMAEADLRDHQLVTQELIQRVNMLDAAVADARRAEAANQETPDTGTTSTAGGMLSDVLRDAREKITQMGDLIAAKGEVAAAGESPAQQAAQVADKQAVEDDLSARRDRLSKR